MPGVLFFARCMNISNSMLLPAFTSLHVSQHIATAAWLVLVGL
jgi:hypothetical protein